MAETSKEELIPFERTFNENYARAMDLFPYEQPNQHQYQIISRILQLKEKGALLLEAPTGSGKTIASLASLLARRNDGEKIVVIVRTVSQMEPIMREWGRIVGGFEGFKKGIANDEDNMILPVMGKARLCKQLPFIRQHMKFSSQAVHFLCKSLPCQLLPNNQKFFKGQYAKPLLMRLDMALAGQSQKGTPTMDRVHDFYGNLKSCGYYKQRELMRHATVIIATYPYLNGNLLEATMKNMGVDISQVLFLVDEAHNLVSPSRTSLTIEHVNKAIFLFGKLRILVNMQSLMKLSKKVQTHELGSDEEIDHLKRVISECVKSVRDKYQITIADLTDDALISLSSFLNSVYIGDIVARKNRMEIVQSTPDVMLSELYGARLAIFQSGTFQPIISYKRLFGMHKAETLVSKESDVSNQFRCYMRYKGLTSLFKKRSPMLYKTMTEVIMEIIPLSPRHVLVLCPSYDFKDELSPYVSEYIVQHNLDTQVLEETRTTSSEKMSNLLIYAKQPYVVLAVAAGKLAEGVEVVHKGNSLISMVIMAGLPFSPPSKDKAIVRQAMTHAARDKKAAQQFMMQIPLERKVKQAFGRTIRTNKDRGALVILDYRAQDYLKKSMKLTRVRNMEQLKGRLNELYVDFPDLRDLRGN
ncbi:MAG: DEAD/DEAH box helicase family protein [Candidatus Heimdallarchaeota archaeon]|nr:DEAD/DEAH box helicase family protein [Candidatus Heimdallarchaeota archaeon]